MITFVAQLKTVESYATKVGDKTYKIGFSGEDNKMAECIAMPGDQLVEVTVKLLPKNP